MSEAKIPLAARPPVPAPAVRQLKLREHVLARALGGESLAIKRWGSPPASALEEGEARANELRGSVPPFDFSRIRIHRDDQADELARGLGTAAFTRGSDMFFRRGAWRPGTSWGNRVLAHELTHAAQQQARGAPTIQANSDEAILEQLEQGIGPEETTAQRSRIEQLTQIFRGLAMWEAGNLLERLTVRKSGDKLAADFHHRLSRQSRARLIGILRQRAETLPLSEFPSPRDDPKYIDNVIEEVRCVLIVADRYTLVWPGGRTTVFNPEIDWTRKSTALPVLDIHATKGQAQAAARDWGDVARGYDNVVTYYRGAGGIVLPTWISPETAPVTYDLIMGVNGQVRKQAKDVYELFRGMRNGMIVGAVLGGFLRILVFRSGGGGGGGRGGARPPDTPTPDEPLPAGRSGGPSSTAKGPGAQGAPPRVPIEAEPIKQPERAGGGSVRGKLPQPAIPPTAKNVNDFGTRIMKWGGGHAEARARIKTITRAEMEASGVTREMAQAWRDFYRNEALRNPRNPSAAGRIDLMQKVVELLGGQ